MVDDYFLEEYPFAGKKVFAIEYLPGQYDQRADACEQCLKILSNATVKVRCARVYVIDEKITDEDKRNNLFLKIMIPLALKLNEDIINR